jgi:hypothetical protein
MLQLDAGTFEIDGVTVFRDHADENQFYYLATEVTLRRRADGRAAFSLIKYRPEVNDAGIEGGGFLMFESAVVIPPATRDKILGRIAGLAPNPQLAPAPIENGTVRCIALNLEGGGGTAAAPPPPGAFTAVTKILGATKPSLVGEQTAAFSLVLDQAGATILEQAFTNGLTPIGVLYDLEYSGLTPDLHVEITADLERVYTHFSAGLEAQIYWLRVGIEAGFEELVKNGAIRIKVIDFAGADDREAKEKWALDFFKNDLLAKWFEPDLDLGKLKGAGQPEGLDAVLERLKRLKNPGGGGSPGGPPGGSPGGSPGGGTPPPLPRATLLTTETQPKPLPGAFGLSLVPGSTTTSETLRVRGPAGAVVTIDGQLELPDAAGSIIVEVPAGSTHAVAADWADGTPVVAIRATLARAARPTSPTPTPTPTPNPTPTPAPPTGGGDLPALVSFKLKFVHQDERKKLTIVYERRKAVKRTYAPQGFVGLLLGQLADKSTYMTSVNLDDPFFRELDVEVVTPVDFASIGLFATDVAIDYGDPANAAGHSHGEFRLSTGDAGPKHFTTFLNQTHDIDFRVGMQHHFTANSGWTGEKLSYDIATRPTNDRTLNVDPHDDLGFLQLEVFPNRIDPGIVDAIDVELSYDDGATFRRRDIIRVRPGDPARPWKLRLTRPDHRSWTAAFTHHLKNGTKRTSPPIQSDASFLPVNDPFVASIDILAVPLFQNGTVRTAFLDVDYDDLTSDYHRRERLEIPGTVTQPVPLRIALMDEDLRMFRYRVTIVTEDGRLIQQAPVTGEETLIGIGP